MTCICQAMKLKAVEMAKFLRIDLRIFKCKSWTNRSFVKISGLTFMRSHLISIMWNPMKERRNFKGTYKMQPLLGFFHGPCKYTVNFKGIIEVEALGLDYGKQYATVDVLHSC